MAAREAPELTKQRGDPVIAASLHRRGKLLVMDRRVLLDLDRIAQKFVDRVDFRAALEAGGGVSDVRSLRRQGLVALEGDDDVLVAHEILASQPIARRHVVDLGVLDLGLGDLAELL